MNKTNPFEIINKMRFFGGQRAGRELWADKPTEIQDADISSFNRDLDILQNALPKWISVEERLPKCGERVLITDGAAVFEAYLSISHKWVRSGLLWQENVTHWMPLPEPPKE